MTMATAAATRRPERERSDAILCRKLSCSVSFSVFTVTSQFPNFPCSLVASAHFMRLSLMKAAHAVVSSAEYRKFGFACSIFSVNVSFASSLKGKFSPFGENEPYLVNSVRPEISYDRLSNYSLHLRRSRTGRTHRSSPARAGSGRLHQYSARGAVDLSLAGKHRIRDRSAPADQDPHCSHPRGPIDHRQPSLLRSSRIPGT